MRWSYTDEKNDFLDKIGKNGSTDTNLLNFFNRNMGAKYQFLLSKFTNYLTQVPKTATTVASQSTYHKPVGVSDIETAVINVGNIAVPLQVVDSQDRFNAINKFPNFTSTFPNFILPRRDDFIIWPTPQAAYTITLNYHLRDKNLSNDDYTTGNITTSNNSQTVTSSGATFTSLMIGRWFVATGDGFWYRIAGVNTGTNALTLETSFEGTSLAAVAYRVCETPELPEEMHPLLAQGTIADYFAMLGDIPKATWWNNVYMTGDGNNNSREEDKCIGGLVGAINTYSERNNSAVVHMHPSAGSTVDKVWAETIVGP